MHRSAIAASIAAAFALAGCATSYSISPIPGASQQIRYVQGTPTTYSEKKLGAIQVTALGVNDDKRLVFQVAAFNKAGVPSNFGVENMSLVQSDGTQDKIFTSADLIHEAKVSAAWAEAGTILAGAAVSVAAAESAHSTTHGTAITPYGSVSYYSRTYDPGAAAAGEAAVGEATGASLEAIQNSLDRTVSDAQNNIVQTTTIDPGTPYGGRVIADELSSSTYPQEFQLHIQWNGDDHVFGFTVAKGTVAPAPQPAGPAPVPAVFRAPAPPEGARTEDASVPPPPAQDQLQSFDKWEHDSGHDSENQE